MFPFPYTVIRKPRRTASITVLRDNTVSLRVPTWYTDKMIHDVLARKHTWIAKKRAENERSPYVPKRFVTGETFRLLDNEYTLRILPGKRGAPYVLDTHVCVPAPKTKATDEAYIRGRVTAWYKAEAAAHFANIVPRIASEMRVPVPKTIRVKSLRSRWGSASSRGAVNFNWRLMMAPASIVTYLVIHELAHFRHPNHSTRFWALVKQHDPCYKEHERFLKEKGKHLDF